MPQDGVAEGVVADGRDEERAGVEAGQNVGDVSADAAETRSGQRLNFWEGASPPILILSDLGHSRLS